MWTVYSRFPWHNVDSGLRGSSHIAGQAERSVPKLLLRGEGRSPLKYIMSVLCQILSILLKKCFTSRLEFGFPFLKNPNFCQEAKLSVPKVLSCRYFGDLSPLEFCH